MLHGQDPNISSFPELCKPSPHTHTQTCALMPNLILSFYRVVTS
jgi:hypothetical protein